MAKYLFAASIAALSVFALTPAQAQTQYPWCAQYGGPFGDGGRNCGFSTYQQCMATISGIGGVCERNPMYGTRKRR